MKLFIKTLKSKIYDVEIKDTDTTNHTSTETSDENNEKVKYSEITIYNLKRIIEEQHGFEVEYTKLLYNGLLLDDKKKLIDYKINEGSTIIIMTSKVIKKNYEEKPVDQETNVKTKIKNEIEDQKVSKIDINSKISEVDKKVNIEKLIKMGFNEKESILAIDKSGNNLKEAINILASSILGDVNNIDDLLIDYNPNHVENVEIHQEMLDNFNLNDPNALNNIVSFLKVLINKDPSALQDLLEEVSETNPEIFDFIKENEEKFKDMMNQPITDDDYKIFDSQFIVNDEEEGEYDDKLNEEVEEFDEGEGEEEAEVEEGEGEVDNQELEKMIKDFDDKDLKSIQNLMGLGFSKFDSVQAYISCDKNEELAADFLLNDEI